LVRLRSVDHDAHPEGRLVRRRGRHGHEVQGRDHELHREAGRNDDRAGRRILPAEGRSAVKRALVVAAVLALPRLAAAQCPSRPADAAGYEGYVYGVAEKTYDTAKVRVHYAPSGTHA